MIALFTASALASTLSVADYGSVQEAIDASSPGDTVLVGPGTRVGAVRVDKAITLRGVGGRLDGGGSGTVLTVAAPGAVIEGLEITHSGSSLTPPDSCVYIERTAVGAIVRDNELTACTFGVWVNQGEAVEVSGNHVVCPAEGRTADKGNGVHLFDSSHLIVRRNTVSRCRDGVYVSATEDSLIEENEASDLRYGIHYMYSYRNTVRGNVAKNNHGGIALMQSRELEVTGNVAVGNNLQGILFRDTQDSHIEGNRVQGNGEGLFFFSCVGNRIIDNEIVGNQIGARVWAGTEGNVIHGNQFLGNRQQVLFVAAYDQLWGDAEAGNTWSDYMGWDQDGDGRGDIAYRVDALTSALLFRFPASVLLLHSPTMELLSWVQARLPVLRVPTIIDEHPQLREAP